MRPSATPTVTMLPIAGERSPNLCRNRTARAGLWANRWLLTSSSPSTCAVLRPSTSRWARSQERAATTASVEEALPRLPFVGRMEAGVPKSFHRSAAPRRDAAAFWVDVGSAVPRRSTSDSPGGVSPRVTKLGRVRGGRGRLAERRERRESGEHGRGDE